MESEDEFRRDFPIADSSLFGGSRDSSELLEALEAFRNRVIGVLSDERLAETFIRFVMTMNPIKRVHTLQRDWVLKDKLKPETQFRIVSAQKLIIRYDTETQYAKLFIRGHVVNLEGIPERLLTDLFNDQGAVVSGGLLTRNCPELTGRRYRKSLSSSTIWASSSWWRRGLTKHGTLQHFRSVPLQPRLWSIASG